MVRTGIDGSFLIDPHFCARAGCIGVCKSVGQSKRTGRYRFDLAYGSVAANAKKGRLKKSLRCPAQWLKPQSQLSLNRKVSAKLGSKAQAQSVTNL